MRHALWLLIVGVMLAASPGLPAAAQVSGPQFVDASATTIGTVGSAPSGDGGPNGDWNVIAVGDYDKDGDDDVLLNLHPGFALYRNNGDGTFTKVPIIGLPAPVAGLTDHRHLLLWCDIDRDEDEDLIIGTGFTSPTRLDLWMRNDGGVFTNIAPALGVEDPGSDDWAATCMDLDRNGWLDVLKLRGADNATNEIRLFMNYGMVFKEEAIARGYNRQGGGAPYAAAYADVNGDGFPEGAHVGNNVNEWVLNRGDGTAFLTSGVYEPLGNLSPYLHDAEAADFNGDGLLDWFILDTFDAEGNAIATLYAGNNQYDPRPIYADGWRAYWWSPQRASADLEPRSVACGDFDNDADIDCFVTRRGGLIIDGGEAKGPDYLYINQGNGTFVERAASVPAFGQFIGTGYGAGGVAVWDYDSDGRLDVVLGYNALYEPGPFRVYRNVSPPQNWVGFRLKAPLIIGANVEVVACGKRQVQQLTARTGWLAQDSRRMHFGLGTCTGPASVKVGFPDGPVASFTAAANAYYTVTPQGVVGQPPPPPPVVISGTWTSKPFVDNNDTHRWISPGIALSGGTAPYSVTFRLGTLFLCSGQANPSIQCAYVPLGSLPNGSYIMTAEVKDASGNGVTLSQAYTVK